MSQRRGPWSNNEDQYLMSLVQVHGALNWVRIAQTLGSRTPKQCRERYHQNLKPSLNHDPISPEEGAEIERLVGELGKRWAEIARRLNGRSDNAVKNWWNGSQNRRKRLDRRRHVQPYEQQHYNRPGLSISTHSFPLSGAQSSPRAAYAHQHLMPWVEAPLPSPCTSESAESDLGSNYTTSPGRSSISRQPVQLPPLRSASAHSPTDSKLPSLISLAHAGYGDASGPRTLLPPLGPQGQLPTAPNSPIQQQFQVQRSQQAQTGEPHMGQPQIGDKDARMNVSHLLR